MKNKNKNLNILFYVRAVAMYLD